MNINNEKERFEHKFKGFQDFEYVKYVLSTLFKLNSDNIELFNQGKKLIPLFSISDVELVDNTVHYELTAPDDDENDNKEKEKENNDEDNDVDDENLDDVNLA